MAVSTRRPESRLVPALVFLGLIALLMILPDRYHVLPAQFPLLLGAVMIVPMILAHAAKPGSPWANVERFVTYFVVVLVLLVELTLISRLTIDIVFHGQIGAIEMLMTAVAVWSTNLVAFAFVYWHADRGGPDGRARGWHGWADFAFAHGDAADGMPPDWQPTFPDYLFLAFTTSTAFSPTDTLPLTTRAKMLMLIEASIALITILMVAARAINILGR